MNRRALLIFAAVLAAVAALAWLLLSGRGAAPVADDIVEVHELPTPTPAAEQRVVLLFAGGDGRLHPELRIVPLPAEVHGRALVVVQELLAGPASRRGRLASPLPYPAELLSMFVDDGGTAFINLSPPQEPLEGSHTELLLAYAVVNSILLNCPELSAVQLLFGGQEVKTLTGHLDLSRPLRLNKRFIAP